MLKHSFYDSRSRLVSVSLNIYLPDVVIYQVHSQREREARTTQGEPNGPFDLKHLIFCQNRLIHIPLVNGGESCGQKRGGGGCDNRLPLIWKICMISFTPGVTFHNSPHTHAHIDLIISNRFILWRPPNTYSCKCLFFLQSDYTLWWIVLKVDGASNSRVRSPIISITRYWIDKFFLLIFLPWRNFTAANCVKERHVLFQPLEF